MSDDDGVQVGERVKIINNRHVLDTRVNLWGRLGRVVQICPHHTTGRMVALVRLFDYWAPIWFDLIDIRPEF